MAGSSDFNGALFGCCGDVGSTCKACFCLPCMISSNSARLDGNENCCLCCYPGSPFKNRAQARARFGFGKPTCGDCLTSVCCVLCSEIQVARELDFQRVISPGYMAVAPAGQSMP